MRLTLLLTLLLVAVVGQSQLMQYARSTTHYVDRNYAGNKWYESGSNAKILFGSSGIYRIQVEAYSGGLPHDYIYVAVNGVNRTVLSAGQTLNTGGTFFYSSSGANLDIGVRFNGPQPACTGSFIRLKLYLQGSGQIVDQMDIHYSTYSPTTVTIQGPPFLTVDHQDQIDWKVVTASQTININPNTTIEPGGLFWPLGENEREFTIAPCLNKRDGFAPTEPLFHDGLSTSELTAYPNPSDGNVKLYFSGIPDASDDVMLEVYSTKGKLVLQQQVPPISGEASINLRDQPKGVYMLKATLGSQIYHQRLMVQ